MCLSRAHLHLRTILTLALLAFTAVGGQAQSGKIDKLEFDEASLEDIIEYFRNNGPNGKKQNVLVDPGVSKEIKVTLTLHDVTRGVAFAYVAEVAGFAYREERHALRILPQRGTPKVKAFLTRGRAVTQRLANEIKLPKVDFDSTQLSQLASDLAIVSRQLDPKKKGVNIILGHGVDPTVAVTLKLSNIPLSGVLKYVSEFARVNVRYDGNAIVLTKRTRRAGQ